MVLAAAMVHALALVLALFLARAVLMALALPMAHTLARAASGIWNSPVHWLALRYWHSPMAWLWFFGLFQIVLYELLTIVRDADVVTYDCN